METSGGDERGYRPPRSMGFDRGFQEGEDGQLREAPTHHGRHHTFHEAATGLAVGTEGPLAPDHSATENSLRVVVDPSDLRVQGLRDSVSDGMVGVVEDPLEVPLDHVGDLAERLEAGSRGPSEPAPEEVPGGSLVGVVPEAEKRLLQGPGSRRPQAPMLQFAEAGPLVPRTSRHPTPAPLKALSRGWDQDHAKVLPTPNSEAPLVPVRQQLTAAEAERLHF
jgi:hypothetical protein